MKKYLETVSSSVQETEKAGAALAKKLEAPAFIAMFGDLGAGKTAFTRGFVEALSIKCEVHSPTFALVNEYSDGNNKVYHFDMYRIMSEDDLYSTGFYDYLDEKAFMLVEWSENILDYLPDNRIEVRIEKSETNDDERIISVYTGDSDEYIGL